MERENKTEEDLNLSQLKNTFFTKGLIASSRLVKILASILSASCWLQIARIVGGRNPSKLDHLGTLLRKQFPEYTILVELKVTLCKKSSMKIKT